MMAMEVDECGTGALSRAEFEITKEELSCALDAVDRLRLKKLVDDGRLNDWISYKDEVVKALKAAYHVSFRLSQSGKFEDEPALAGLRGLLVTQLAELRAVLGLVS
jgi:hypothetical protein